MFYMQNLAGKRFNRSHSSPYISQNYAIPHIYFIYRAQVPLSCFSHFKTFTNIWFSVDNQPCKHLNYRYTWHAWIHSITFKQSEGYFLRPHHGWIPFDKSWCTSSFRQRPTLVDLKSNTVHQPWSFLDKIYRPVVWEGSSLSPLRRALCGWRGIGFSNYSTTGARSCFMPRKSDCPRKSFDQPYPIKILLPSRVFNVLQLLEHSTHIFNDCLNSLILL